MDFGEDGTRSKLRPGEFELPVREWNGLSVKMILQQNCKDESNRKVYAGFLFHGKYLSIKGNIFVQSSIEVLFVIEIVRC